MIDYDLLKRAMRAEVIQIEGMVPVERMSFENETFVPPTIVDAVQSMWLEEQVVPLSESQVATGMIGGIFYFLYKICVPVGMGTKEADKLSLAMRDRFQPGSAVSLEGMTFEVDESVRKQGLTDGPWFYYPVRITGRAYVLKGA